MTHNKEIMNPTNGKLVVYLANLSHDSLRSRADDMPLGISDIGAYLDSQFPGELDISLFRYTEELERAINEKKPHIVGFSNYCWTENISKAWATVIKEKNPDTLVLMGGPNFPLDESRQLEFLQSCPAIDLYVRLEGELATKVVIDEYKKNNGKISEIKQADLPSCTLLSPDGSQLKSHPLHARIQNMDDVPSPYLNNFMDGFFDGQLIPTLQTNRGCPFQCTFCNSGDVQYNSISHFSVERVSQELEYIGKKIKETCPHIGVLRIVDDNFAMYSRDEEIVQAIIRTQERYGFPKKIIVSTGKNKPERILNSVKQLDGTMGFTAAVQTMDAGVLKAVKRQNISREAYFNVAEELGKTGLVGYADTILGLPEESKESYYDGFRELIDAGIQTVNTTTAYMMMGSELETDATRKEFNIKTHWRMTPGTWVMVAGEPVMEMEEIITSTSKMPFEDWLECRSLQLWLRIFSFEWHFEVLHKCLKFHKINFLDVILKMREILEEAPTTIQETILQFEEEVKEELFDSREDIVEFYSIPENKEKLLSGEMGHALARKYGGPAKIEYFSDFANFAYKAAIKVFEDKNKTESKETLLKELKTIMSYMEGQKVSWDGAKNLKQRITVELNHDVEKWKTEGYSKSLSCYEYPSAIETLFEMDDKIWKYTNSVIDEFYGSTFGLMKIYLLLNVRHFNRTCFSGDREPAHLT